MYYKPLNPFYLGILNGKNFKTHFPHMNGNYQETVEPVTDEPKKFPTLKEVYDNPEVMQAFSRSSGLSSNRDQYFPQPTITNVVLDPTAQQYANYYNYFALQNQAISIWSSSQYAVDRYYQMLFAGFNPLAGYRNLDGTPMDPWICGPVSINDNDHVTKLQEYSSIDQSVRNSMNLDGFSSISQPTNKFVEHKSTPAKIKDLSKSTPQKTDSVKEDVKNVLKLMKNSKSLRDYTLVQGLPEIPMPYHIYYISKPEEVQKALLDANEVLTLDLNNNDRSKTIKNTHLETADPMIAISPLNKSYSEDWPELGTSVGHCHASTSNPKTAKKQGQSSGRKTSRFLELKKAPEDNVQRLEPAQFVPVYARLSTSPGVCIKKDN